MYNVFADFHHSALFYSLHKLFVQRLGGTLYRPIGENWHKEGYWKIYDHPATVAQYLSINSTYTPIDGTLPLNTIKEVRTTHYEVAELAHNYTQKAITYEQFTKLPIDIVIASIPEHIEPFKQLCKYHPNQPKLIFQVGNSWSYVEGVDNVMASALIEVPSGVNSIIYHQEFDDPITQVPAQRGQDIISLVNCFDTQSHYSKDWQLFQEVEAIMGEYTFKCLGAQCRDGSVDGYNNVIDSIYKARYVWHTKAGGDGYGHIIHNIFACGAVPIIKRDYYTGKLAQRLINDSCCIIIDGLTPQEIASKIRSIDYTTWLKMTASARAWFDAVVDFDLDELRLRKFLQNLK